jgi:hypothetical protein
MEPYLMPDILQAAIEERYRIEAVLRSNPDFQRLEAVRRVIALYEGVAQVPTRVNPVANYDLPEGTVRPGPVPNPDQPTIIQASDPHTPPDSSIRPRRRRWTWEDSQTSQIRAAACDYLQTIGRRAKSGEIYKAIASKGVVIDGKKPTAIVCARMSASAIFDRTPEGYGLTEWSDAGAPRKDGQIGVA